MTYTHSLILAVVLGASSAFMAGCSTPSLNSAILNQDKREAWKLMQDRRLLVERDAQGNTPLHLAAARLDLPLIRDLIGAGAEINAVNNAGDSPLAQLLSAPGYDVEATEVLLAAKADPNLANKEGVTPLMLGSGKPCSGLDSARKLDVVKALLKAGGDPARSDRRGRDALFHAAGTRPVAVVRLLAERGGSLAGRDEATGFDIVQASAAGGRRENAFYFFARGVRPSAASPAPDASAAREPWVANGSARVAAITLDWFGVWTMSQATGDRDAAARAFAVAAESYELALTDYRRAVAACAAELPKARSELTAMKTKAFFTNLLSTAGGLAVGYNTGVGWVQYTMGEFPNRPAFLEFLQQNYERLDREMSARLAVLRRAELLQQPELWRGRPAAAGPWSGKRVEIRDLSASVGQAVLPALSNRAGEIKLAMDEFADALDRLGLFSCVTTDVSADADSGAIPLDLDFTESEDNHVGAQVGKAMAVGFFTLGLAGDFTSGSYTYETTVMFTLRLPDKEPVRLTATKSRTVKYAQNEAGARDRAVRDVRVALTREAFAEILERLPRSLPTSSSL